MEKTIKQPETFSTTFENIEDGEVFFITEQAQNPPDKRVYHLKLSEDKCAVCLATYLVERMSPSQVVFPVKSELVISLE